MDAAHGIAVLLDCLGFQVCSCSVSLCLPNRKYYTAAWLAPRAKNLYCVSFWLFYLRMACRTLINLEDIFIWTRAFVQFLRTTTTKKKNGGVFRQEWLINLFYLYFTCVVCCRPLQAVSGSVTSWCRNHFFLLFNLDQLMRPCFGFGGVCCLREGLNRD